MGLEGRHYSSLRSDGILPGLFQPIDEVFSVPIWVDWNRTPVSVHDSEQESLELLILHLRNTYNVRRRSLVMPDRERGGFLFFIYQACNPLWIADFVDRLEEE